MFDFIKVSIPHRYGINLGRSKRGKIDKVLVSIPHRYGINNGHGINGEVITPGFNSS